MVLSRKEEYKKCPAFFGFQSLKNSCNPERIFLLGYRYFYYTPFQRPVLVYMVDRRFRMIKKSQTEKSPFPEIIVNFFYLFRSNATAPEGTPPRRIIN